ncbi:MAG: hypothetical protein U0230_20765 [Polyangiales bacterium]
MSDEEETAPGAPEGGADVETPTPRKRRRWHLVAGIPLGFLVGGGLGGLEGMRQGYYEALSHGTGADAGIYLVVFGPMIAMIYAGMGLGAGALIGSVAGLGSGVFVERWKARNVGREGWLGRPLAYWGMHLGFWALLTFVCVRFADPIEHVLHQVGIVAREAPAGGGEPAPRD